MILIVMVMVVYSWIGLLIIGFDSIINQKSDMLFPLLFMMFVEYVCTRFF